MYIVLIFIKMCKVREMLIIRFFYFLLVICNFGSIYCIVLIDIDRWYDLLKVYDFMLKIKEDIF